MGPTRILSGRAKRRPEVDCPHSGSEPTPPTRMLEQPATYIPRLMRMPPIIRFARKFSYP